MSTINTEATSQTKSTGKRKRIAEGTIVSPHYQVRSGAPSTYKGMFEGSAGNADNWTITTTTIVGGENYQHPHSDQGVVESYHGQTIFPFVCLHGFGIDEFSLWLLPDALETKYGFLHTFRSYQIVFLRGDFVHAGVPSPVPRGHFAFCPSVSAGWTRYYLFAKHNVLSL
jgi:hypothetical protein